MLNMDCTAKKEATATNAHEARHVQCKLKAGIVRHKIFMTKVLQKAICYLQCINTHDYQPQQQIFYNIIPTLSPAPKCRS